MFIFVGKQYDVHVDGTFGPYSHVSSGVPQGSVLGPLLFILYTCDIYPGVINNVMAYTDDTSPATRQRVADNHT